MGATAPTERVVVHDGPHRWSIDIKSSGPVGGTDGSAIEPPFGVQAQSGLSLLGSDTPCACVTETSMLRPHRC